MYLGRSQDLDKASELFLTRRNLMGILKRLFGTPGEGTSENSRALMETQATVARKQPKAVPLIDLVFNDKTALNFEEDPEPPTKADVGLQRHKTDYWTIYRAIELAYANEEPERALKLFSELRETADLHSGALPLYLRAYRKQRDKLIKEGNLRGAFAVSENMLREEILAVTPNDERKHIKLGQSLGVRMPEAMSTRMAPPKRKPEEFIRLTSSRHWQIGETSPKAERDKGQSKWKDRVITEYGTVEIAPWGLAKFGEPDPRAMLRFHSTEGESHISELNGVAYRIGWNPYASAFITMSPEMVVSVRQLQGDQLCSLRLPLTEPEGTGTDKYQVRCVATSGDGSRSLFSRVRQAAFLDNGLGEIWLAQTPPAPGVIEERSSPASRVPSESDSDVAAAAQTLGIEKGAKAEEIKRAYRTMAVRHHPDKNPGDPRALDLMKSINAAYEVLLDQPASEAWDTESEVVTYYSSLTRTTFETDIGTIEFSIGVVGQWQDWIYSAAINPEGTRVFLGCYSGRIFELDASGHTIKTIKFNEPITTLMPLESHLLIETHSWIVALAENKVCGTIAKQHGSSVTYYPGGVMLLQGKRLLVFDRDLKSMGEIEAFDTVRGFWKAGESLAIETNRAITKVDEFFI